MENQNKEREITFAQLWNVFKKSFIFLVIAGILGVSLGVVYAVVVDKPSYKAEVAFLITTISTDHEYTSSSQTAASNNIANSCYKFINKGASVKEAVAKHNLVEKFGILPENSEVDEYSKLRCESMVKSMISAYKEDPEDSLFVVSVTSGSKQRVYDAIVALQDVIPGFFINEYKNTINVSVASPITNLNSVRTVDRSPITLGLLGGIAAAVIAYAVFFIISMFDTAIYGEGTLKEHFTHPIVGHIPSLWMSDEEKLEKKKNGKSKKNPKIIVRNYEKKLLDSSSPFFITEAFNSLRTNLVYSAAAEKNPIFAMTSDVAGAGKTVVSANLAISFANLGKKVLLVECDMRCPSFSKVFGRRHENGLSELLAGMFDNTADVICDIGVENLDVICGGKIPPNPSELLSSARMQELALKWKSEYDYIILDMPPIGEVFDAGVVSSIVNGYVVTVRCNHSNINDVRESIERINAVNGNMLGIVLNDIDPKINRRYKIYYGSSDKQHQ